MMKDEPWERWREQMVSVLRRGQVRRELAEDAAQDALAAAVARWPEIGQPSSPEAWLLRAARNRAVDGLRRESRWRCRPIEEQDRVEDAPDLDLNDEGLRVLLACSDPRLPEGAALPLALRTLGELPLPLLAAALRLSTTASAQRLVRARRRLQGLDTEDLSPERLALAEALLRSLEEVAQGLSGPEVLALTGELSRLRLLLDQLLPQAPPQVQRWDLESPQACAPG